MLLEHVKGRIYKKGKDQRISKKEKTGEERGKKRTIVIKEMLS